MHEYDEDENEISALVSSQPELKSLRPLFAIDRLDDLHYLPSMSGSVMWDM